MRPPFALPLVWQWETSAFSQLLHDPSRSGHTDPDASSKEEGEPALAKVSAQILRPILKTSILP